MRDDFREHIKRNEAVRQGGEDSSYKVGELSQLPYGQVKFQHGGTHGGACRACPSEVCPLQGEGVGVFIY